MPTLLDTRGAMLRGRRARRRAIAAGLDGSHPLTIHAKMLRLELLKVKADLERELGQLVLDCTDCGPTVHWVAELSTKSGHWAHREPAPHREPVV